MNFTPYVHLVWKECRAARAFWLAIVVLAVLLQALTTRVYGADSSNLVYTLALAAPAFFALGCTGMSFALEHEEGTFDFLRAAPISPRQVFLSKLSVPILATCVMFLVLWPPAVMFTKGQLPSGVVLQGMLGLWVVAALEATAWGLLFSLLCKRPLVAVSLALAVTSTVTHLSALRFADAPLDTLQLAPYLAAAPLRVLIALGVLVVDVRLGLTWLKREEPVGRARFWVKAESASDSKNLEGLAAAEIDVAARPDRSAMLGHLLWQHCRQSVWLMLLLAGLQIILSLLLILPAGVSRDGVVLPMAVLAGLMGSCVFLLDQERSRFRFFSEHNVPPRYVWLTRQLLWSATLIISTALISFIWLSTSRLDGLWDAIESATQSHPMSGRASYPYYVYLPPVAIGIAFVAVAYAAGQWTSMHVRSGIMAGFFGLLLGILLCGWVLLMDTMRINWLWSVAPIPCLLLWATWLRAPDWISENTTRLARTRAATVVLVPALALLIAVPIYRVHEIPLVDPGFDPRAYLAEITPEALATGEMYRRAIDLYVPPPRDPSPNNDLEEPVSRIPTARILKWLDDNEESLALVLEATRRSSCVLFDLRPASPAPNWSKGSRLYLLVLHSGRKLEAEGKLDEALDRYFVAMQFLSQWANHGFGNYLTNSEAQRIFSEVTAWSAHKDQTAERVTTALDRVSKLNPEFFHLGDELKSQYIVTRRYLLGDVDSLYGEGPTPAAQLLWIKLMPWERERAVRMLNILTATALERLDMMRQHLADGEGVIHLVSPLRNFQQDDFFEVFYSYRGWQTSEARRKALWLDSTRPHVSQNGYWGLNAAWYFAEIEARRRGTVIVLALEAHRLAHGELPESLTELVGPILDSLPLDPYSGKDFRYFRTGIPVPATPLQEAELQSARDLLGQIEIVPAKPCVWCTGSDLAAFTTRRGVEPDRDPADAELEQWLLYRSRNTQLLWGTDYGLPAYVAWAKGHWFPIPAQP